MTFPYKAQAHGRRKLGLAIGAASLALGVVAAGYAMGQSSSLDTDGDGLVTYTELLAALPDLTETDFAAMDTDGSGSLDSSELTAAEEAGMIPAG